MRCTAILIGVMALTVALFVLVGATEWYYILIAWLTGAFLGMLGLFAWFKYEEEKNNPEIKDYDNTESIREAIKKAN